jgi:hypothetical protein
VTACDEAIGPEAAQALFDRLTGGAPSTDGCVLSDVSTLRTRIEVSWSKPGVGSLPAATVAPSICTPGAEAVRGELVATIPPELREACPAAAEGLRHAVATRTLPVIALPQPDNGVTGRGAWAHDALPTIAWGAFVLSLAALVVIAWPAIRRLRARDERAGPLLSLGLFALALAVRVATPPSPSNWYTEVVLPPSGGLASSGRFGPGAATWQELLRAILPWRESTFMLAQQIAGATMVPLAMSLFAALAVPLDAAASAGLLLALAPLHVRASSSSSEHVVSSTLTIAIFVLWHRGVRRPSIPALVLCLPLAVAVVVTRVDAWPFLLAVPLLPAVADSSEAVDPPQLRRARWLGGLYLAVWLLVGLAAYAAIVVPSHHPGPDLAGVVYTARGLFSQYARVAWEPPHWYAPVAVLLGVPGLIILARRRLALLARVALCLGVAFVPVGRLLEHDGLLGARYFLATLPFSLLPAGIAFGVLLDAASRVRTRRWIRACAFAGLVAAAAVPALPAYRYRYTFQDEQAWLRGALADVPLGCTVYSLPVRSPAFEIDLDGSLDVSSSTLRLAYPELSFVTLPVDATAYADPRDACAVYYETSACSMQPTRDVRARLPAALAWYGAACAAMRARVESGPIAWAEVSAASTNDLFGDVRPRVGMYWWRRPAHTSSTARGRANDHATP